MLLVQVLKRCLGTETRTQSCFSSRGWGGWEYNNRCPDASQSQVPELPFNKALRMMNMEPTVEDDSSTVTPAAKRPRRMEVVDAALRQTPPPVVGPQTVS